MESPWNIKILLFLCMKIQLRNYILLDLCWCEMVGGGCEIFTRNWGEARNKEGTGGLGTFKVLLHSWQKGANPLILWRLSPILHTPYPLFQILSTPLPHFPVTSNPHPHCSFCCHVSLAEWVIKPYLMCHGSTHAKPWYLGTWRTLMCFMQKGVKFTEVWHVMWFFAGTMTQCHTHTNTQHTQHTQGPVDWHTHINIYLHHLLCAHSSCLYFVKWLNEWFTDIKNLTSTMSFLFKNYSLVKVIYLLIRCYETRFFLWNIYNTDRNGVNKQNIHTHIHQTHRER